MRPMTEPHQPSPHGSSGDLDSQAIASALEGGKYVYCIIRSDRPRDFGSIGIGGGQRVYTVGFNDLAAVVSDVLDKMRDKIEFGLKILWERDKVIANIERDNDEIRRLKDEIGRNTASSTYFARMQLGRLVEAAMEEAGNRYVNDIHEQLKEVSVASRSSKVIGDRMILNAAFLVERKDEKSFD